MLRFSEAQALLRHQVPDGDLAEIFDRALTLLLVNVKRKKFGQTSRTVSRHIPAEIKRAVVARDGGRSAYMARFARRDNCTRVQLDAELRQ